ncbi:hypothetical protein Q5692_13545 [Microcoleus sp. C2C3]|uniref:hypothetical protein n=1 Tax=unclassified Microcoleus TaxID=2642155 RepID=UPI002FD48749
MRSLFGWAIAELYSTGLCKEITNIPRRISAVSGLLKSIARANIFGTQIAFFGLIGVLNSAFYFLPWGDTSGGNALPTVNGQ